MGKIVLGGIEMIAFFLEHVPAFLTMGISIIGATLLRTAARIYAGKDH